MTPRRVAHTSLLVCRRSCLPSGPNDCCRSDPLLWPARYCILKGNKIGSSKSASLVQRAGSRRSASGPKQKSAVRPVPVDQRTVARAMHMGKAGKLARRAKAASLTPGERSPQGR
jgi:hypothetical protein